MERCSHLGLHDVRYIREKSTDRITTYVLICPLFSHKKIPYNASKSCCWFYCRAVEHSTVCIQTSSKWSVLILVSGGSEGQISAIMYGRAPTHHHLFFSHMKTCFRWGSVVLFSTQSGVHSSNICRIRVCFHGSQMFLINIPGLILLESVFTIHFILGSCLASSMKWKYLLWHASKF